MKPEERFPQVVNALKEKGVTFAVVGGLAARYYRGDNRLTKDVDIAIDGIPNPSAFAKSLMQRFGLAVFVSDKAHLEGKLFANRKQFRSPTFIIFYCLFRRLFRFKYSTEMMIGGQSKGKPDLDICLPSAAWVPDAVKNAQNNMVDFGFGEVPLVRVEDLILGKMISLSSAHPRDHDVDDIQTILNKQKNFDFLYLANRIKELNIGFPFDSQKLTMKSLLEVKRWAYIPLCSVAPIPK